MIATLLFMAAAPAAASGDLMLGCRLATPAGDEIAFSARLGAPTGVLEPIPGTAWPTRRVIGPGAWRDKNGLEAHYHFAGSPSGVDLKVDAERATLLVGKRLRSGLPRAHGFCLPLADASAVRSDGLVSPNAGAQVPAFDIARWPDTCGLVTRSGSRALIDYEILNRGSRSAIRTSDTSLLSSGAVAVPRVQGHVRSRFGGREGPAGTERFFVDAKAGQAVQLLDFDRIGASAEPAAAICGYSSIVARAAR